MTVRQWLAWASLNLFIMGMVFAFFSLAWQQTKYIYTPDIHLSGSANE